MSTRTTYLGHDLRILARELAIKHIVLPNAEAHEQAIQHFINRALREARVFRDNQ